MIELDDLDARFDERRRARGLRRSLEITNKDFLLGADTLLATGVLEGEEARALALLAAAHVRALSPLILDIMRKAQDLWSRGEKSLAQLHLTFARLPPLTDDQAFALFAADELLKSGLSPHALMKGLGFDPAALDTLEKYSADQPRVPAGNGRASGQWTSGGGAKSSRQQYAQADEQPPLKRIHPDSTCESDQTAKSSLRHWRTKPTDHIIESLKPTSADPLLVRPNGDVANGNTRLKVLEERGVNVNTLPRLLYDDLNSGLHGGGGQVRELPPEE